jgi:hypothetical protein
VTGLTNGTAYTFTVAAINGVGTGPGSTPSGAVTPATTPGAPTGVSGTSGDSQVTLSWTAPASDGGSAVTGYVVTPSIGGVAQTPTTFSSAATTQTLTGLTNGMAYTFTVAAINGAGTGPGSTPSGAVTPATTPGAPTIVSGTGLLLVTLSWTAPASDGGSAITGYIVTPYLGGVAQTPTTFSSTATTRDGDRADRGPVHVHRDGRQRGGGRTCLGAGPVRRGESVGEGSRRRTRRVWATPTTRSVRLSAIAPGRAVGQPGRTPTVHP